MSALPSWIIATSIDCAYHGNFSEPRIFWPFSPPFCALNGNHESTEKCSPHPGAAPLKAGGERLTQSHDMKIKLIPPTVFLLAALFFDSSANADVISDWNHTASEVLDPYSIETVRVKAMMHLAQFDAVNAVLGGYKPYALNIAAPAASAEAAAAQAAFSILTNISRANISTWNAALVRSLEAFPEGPAREDAIQLGKLVAEAIIQLRAADNTRLSVPAPTSTALGRWRPTPPSFSPGVAAQFRYFTPFTMRTISQFRQGPPPALNSETYTADYAEVRLVGARNSATRTPEQTKAAHFYEAVLETDLLDAIFPKRSLSLIESARMHALFYAAFFDAVASVCATKYAYNFWRPVTAIQAGENDGNPATTGDTAWTAFYDTHAHPDYPSQAAQAFGAVIEILISVYGDEFSFDVSTTGFPPRTFQRLSDFFEDVVVGRIAAGMHFRYSCVVGVETGREIARHAIQNFLRPVPRLATGAAPRSGEFQLSLITGPAVSYAVETSGDLLQWVPWQTHIYGTIQLTDSNAAGTDHRFYRAHLLPW